MDWYLCTKLEKYKVTSVKEPYDKTESIIDSHIYLICQIVKLLICFRDVTWTLTGML